jgi:hypothetical protein
MSPQVVTGLVGIASAAVAALGLLLAWYRRDAQTTGHPAPRTWWRRVFTRPRVAALCAVAVVGAATAGVIPLLSAGTPTPEPTAGPPPLTEVEYGSRLSGLCLQSDEEGRRIEEAEPSGPVLGAAIDIERRLVDRIEALDPPASYRSAHDELVATWRQRIALLESAYQKLAAGDTDVAGDLGRADELAATVTEKSTALGAPECAF